MKTFRLRNGRTDHFGLEVTEVPAPQPSAHEVILKVTAASLNYRDLIVASARLKGGRDGTVPLSDAAGVVIATGRDVSMWKPGDRVVASFFKTWTDGAFRSEFLPSALGGGATDGVLAEQVTVPEKALARVPDGMSFETAATLPCAAVTAYHALGVRAPVAAGHTVLIQGSGGVALFAMQIARARGASTIMLSSSDEKIEALRKLGCERVINYKTTPDWDAKVLAMTEGCGVTHVVELGGPDTYKKSINAVAAGGAILQIGVLTGFDPSPGLGRLQSLNATIHGVTVGSAAHLNATAQFFGDRNLTAVIDSVFPFEKAPEAYARLASGKHLGKILIAVA